MVRRFSKACRGPVFFFTEPFNDRTLSREIVTQFIASLELDERDLVAWWLVPTGRRRCPYHARKSIIFLREFFAGERLITRPLRPARSPDLPQPDFFFFVGFLEDRVFRQSPQSLDESKVFVTQAFTTKSLRKR